MIINQNIKFQHFPLAALQGYVPRLIISMKNTSQFYFHFSRNELEKMYKNVTLFSMCFSLLCQFNSYLFPMADDLESKYTSSVALEVTASQLLYKPDINQDVIDYIIQGEEKEEVVGCSREYLNIISKSC